MKLSRITIIISTLAIVFGVSNTARAANKYWNVSGTNDWHAAGNWSGGVPGSSDSVFIENGGTSIISNSAATAGFVWVAKTSAYNGGLILSNQTLTIGDLELGRDAGTTGRYEQYGANSKLITTSYGIHLGRGKNTATPEGCFTLHDGLVDTTGSSGWQGSEKGVRIGGDTTAYGKGTFTILGGLLKTVDFTCGYKGTGTYNQSGGSNIVNGVFYIGRASGSTGTMTLSGGTVDAKNNFYVGNSGTGTYNQDAGTNSVTGTFYVGAAAGSSGTVTISGGTFTNSGSAFYLGSNHASAKSHLTIQGGNASVYIKSLQCNAASDDTITFVLDGNTGTKISALNCGSVSFANNAKIEYKLGAYFQGSKNETYTLISSGGTIDTNNCTFVDSTGTPSNYFSIAVSGNKLILTQNEKWPLISTKYWQGTANQTKDWNTASNWSGGTPGSNDNAVIENGGTALISTENASVNLMSIAYKDSNSTGGGLILSNRNLTVSDLGVGCSINAAAYYDQYGTNSKLTTTGDGICIGRENEADGYFTLHDGEVDTTVSSNRKDVCVGGDLESSGKGSFTILGGSLKTRDFYCGYKGTGTYIQSGGINTMTGDFYGGKESGSTGTATLSGGLLDLSGNIMAIGEAGNGLFTLSGGKISEAYLYCGNNGNGTYNQSGGTNAVSDGVYVGVTSGSEGTMSISGGKMVLADEMHVGESGTGTYNQSGGINTVSNGVYVGVISGGEGAMSISGGQMVLAGELHVGESGAGTYNQSGGTNTVNMGVYVGVTSNSEGSIEISGGQLSLANELHVGEFGTGIYNQSGGTNTVRKSIYVGVKSDGDGTMTISDGKISTPHALYIGNSGIAAYNQDGGYTKMRNCIIGHNTGASGTLSISNGYFHLAYNHGGGNLYCPGSSSAAGKIVVRGGKATINVSNTLNCKNGGTSYISFILDGASGPRISTIECNKALLNNTHVSLEYKLGENFRGSAGDTYTLISCRVAGRLKTAGCNFIDSTGAPAGTFTLTHTGKDIILTLNEDYASYPILTQDEVQCYYDDLGINLSTQLQNQVAAIVKPEKPWPQWRVDAAARIDRYRKSDLTINVVDNNGNPVPRASVHIYLINNDFRFGSALNLYNWSADNDNYRNVVNGLFNAVGAQNGLKPKIYGKHYLLPSFFNWAETNGLPVRGHLLMWSGRSNLPYADPYKVRQALDALRAAQNQTNPPATEEEIATLKSNLVSISDFMVGDWASKWPVCEWDVINEPMEKHDIESALDDYGQMARWFDIASSNKVLPECSLMVNDYMIISAHSHNDFLYRSSAYRAKVTRIEEDGGYVDGIGFQSRFKFGHLNPTSVNYRLSYYEDAYPDKKLVGTEFEIKDGGNVTNNLERAQMTEEIMTSYYSHPQVTGLFVWTFKSGLPYAMSDSSGNLHLNAMVWYYLHRIRYTTDESLVTGSDGKISLSAFNGYYIIDIEANGNSYTSDLYLLDDDTATIQIAD